MTKHYISGFLTGLIVVAVYSCASVRKFDASTATFSETEKERILFWNVDDREDLIIESLDAHGKLKVIKVKEENPIIQWIFGAGLALGAVCILIGLGYIWMTKGVKLVEGLLIIGFGVTDFALFYFLDRYIVWISIAVGLAFVASLVYIFFFNKDLLEKLISSFEEQKEVKFSSVESHVKSTQGNKQKVIAKIRKKVLK